MKKHGFSDERAENVRHSSSSNASRRKTSGVDGGAGGGDEAHGLEEASDLSVAKLPALVREDVANRVVLLWWFLCVVVDVLIQTLATSPPQGGSHDAFELCGSILGRVEEVEAFRRTLRPGPLEAIVRKQVTRLEAAVQRLRHPSETRRSSFLGLQSVSPRIVPFRGGIKPRNAHKPILLVRKNKDVVRTSRAPKPIYKWERRRTARASTQLTRGQQQSPALRDELRRQEYVDDDAEDASMELRACTEPGHYIRRAASFAVDAESGTFGFEVQLLLTEDELKSLKTQERDRKGTADTFSSPASLHQLGDRFPAALSLPCICTQSRTLARIHCVSLARRPGKQEAPSMEMDRPRTLSKAVSQLDQYDKPSVDVAKTWLETVILPRRFYDEKTNTYRMVEMGEDSTGSELFPVWGTSLRDLYAFGIGIGLYFRMLLQLGVLMFVLAAVSMPSIVYFLSDAYSGPISERTLEDDTKLDIRIWGTAACTRQTEIQADGGTMQTNNCPVTVDQLHVDLIVLVILSLYSILSGVAQERMKAFIDELEQTAADYSIVVKDPNRDAWNPDEWATFFSQFGKVKFVTVAVNNHELLSALARKRYMEEMLRMETSDQEVTEAALQSAIDGPLPPSKCGSFAKRFCQKFFMFRDLEYWTRVLYYQRKKIETFLSHGSYPVWSVFVMFETEEAQRKCIQQTKAGVCATVFDFSATSFPKEFRFRGSNILQIEQAVEPSSVQWKNVGVQWPRRFSQQLLNLAIVIAMMVGVYYFTMMLKAMYVVGDDASESKRRKNLYILAYALAVTDLLGCKVLHYVDLLEQHQTKEREQLSTLNKMLLFRVFNGAVVIYLLTDFTDMLSEQNLLQIQAILIANLVTTPVLQLLSIYDRVMQWVYGPKAKTQKKLNQYYSGTHWQLAERYTQITKIVGTALFFKSLIPTGLVITALSLFLNYWVDKYCLLRKWKVPPKYDGLLARASRYHLLFMALTSLIMMGHWYDGWPFDQQTELEVTKHRTGTHSEFEDYVVYLVQLIFPFERDYQSEEQTEMMRALVLAIVVVTFLTLAFLILKSLYRTWNRYVIGLNRGRSSRTKVSATPCSSLKHLDGYVPSYESWYSDFPYLCVPLHHFEHRFINWSGDHSEYCLVNDVTDDPALARHLGDRPLEQLFGVCKQYDLPASSHHHDHATDPQGDLEACGESESQLFSSSVSIQMNSV